MPDEGEKSGDETSKDENINKPDDKDTSKGGGDGQEPVPYHRFTEVNDKLKSTSEQLAKLKEQQKKAEEERLEKSKKYQELATKRKEEADELRAKLEKTRIQNAVERVAIKEGIKDTEAAYKLVDLSGVSVEDDGTISGVEEAIKSLVEQRPYIVEGKGKPASTIGAGANPDEGDKDIVPLSWVREKWADVPWTKAKHEKYGGLTGAEYLTKLEEEGRIDPNS